MAVYFAKNETTGNIKIGYSLNPASRVANLQTSNCAKVALIGVIYDGSIKTEKELHERFKAHRVHGEWYTSTAELEDLISNNRPQPWTMASVEDFKNQLAKLRLEKK